MSYVPTLTLLDAVKAAVAAIPLPGTTTGEKLFEVVDYHLNKRLAEALKDLVITEQRVCLIVPGGHSYVNTPEGRTVRSTRTTTFDLLVADRDWADAGHQAVFGGPEAIGTLTMSDLVVAALAEAPQLGLPYVLLQVEESAQITLADAEVKDSAGRECGVLAYSTPSGERVLARTQAWAVPTS